MHVAHFGFSGALRVPPVDPCYNARGGITLWIRIERGTLHVGVSLQICIHPNRIDCIWKGAFT
jgi:hypothetical protein